jgi:hypothetical protein
MSLVFSTKDGNGNINDVNGNEAMNVVDDEGERFNIKQLVIYETYV